jgi:tRNA modification GTPase
MNKTDAGIISDPPIPDPVYMSAKTGDGFDTLKEKILAFAGSDMADNEDIIVSARQYAAVQKALENINDAIIALDGFTQDISGECIERAISALGEIDGRTATIEIVNEIFSHFCVGK